MLKLCFRVRPQLSPSSRAAACLPPLIHPLRSSAALRSPPASFRRASTSSKSPRTRRSTPPPTEPLLPEEDELEPFELVEEEVPEEEVTASSRFTLRPYQVECIKSVLSELRKGEITRLGVSAPTGESSHGLAEVQRVQPVVLFTTALLYNELDMDEGLRMNVQRMRRVEPIWTDLPKPLKPPPDPPHSSTGSGKTAMFTSLIHHLPPRIHPVTNELATRVLIIVNSIQLAQQTAAVVQRSWPNLLVEIEQGSNRASGMADVTVATYHTLARGDLARLNKFDPEYFKAVIVDEAHHAAARSYLSILSRFDSRISESLASSFAEGEDMPAASSISPAPSDVPPPSPSTTEDSPPCLPDDPPEPVVAQLDDQGRMRVPLLGFTATWGRADGLALGKLFQKIVWHGEWLDMIEGRWLSQLQFTTVRLGQALDLADVDVSSSTGEFNTASLAKAVDKREVNELAINAWIEKASDRRSTLVFAVNISHIYSLANAFRERGIDARCVSQETKVRDRDELYAAFRAGEFPVLINCGILTEGADFPEIDCVLLARPTRSQNLFLQMIGRGLRVSPQTGKTNCLLIDLVGNSAMGVVCTPTLFGIDPDEAIEGKTSMELKELGDEAAAKKEAHALSPIRRYAFQYRDYQSAFEFVSLHKKEGGAVAVPIDTLSKLAWVGCTDSKWVLELIGHGHVKIVKETDGDADRFSARLYVRLPSSRGEVSRYAFTLPHLIASHSSLPILLRTTDAYLLKQKKYHEVMLRRNSPWRRSPATESQRTKILQKLLSTQDQPQGKRTIEGVWVGKPWREEVDVDQLTRGQASDVICRLKHGGLGWWERQRRMLMQREKAERRQRMTKEDKAKERQRRQREKITARTDGLPAGKILSQIESEGTMDTGRPA